MSQWDYYNQEENDRMEEHHTFTAPIRESEDWAKKVVIVGAGDFGRETAEIAKRIFLHSRSINLLGFLDDNEKLHGREFNNVKVLGGLDYFKDQQDIYFVCAIADPKTKKKIVKQVLSYDYKPINLIDPSVIMFSGVKLGKGIIINVNTCLMANVIIEDHVHINLLCSVGHDAHIGAYSTISPQCVLSGFTLIGMGCFLGSGVITFPYIGMKRCKVGAGSVVTKDLCQVDGTYIGNPARLLKR